MTNLELEKTANEIRKSIVTAVHSAKSGHPGGSLSSADIFTYLYFEEMNIDPCILFFSAFHGFLGKFQCQSDVFLMCSQNNSSSDFFFYYKLTIR